MIEFFGPKNVSHDRSVYQAKTVPFMYFVLQRQQNIHNLAYFKD